MDAEIFPHATVAEHALSEIRQGAVVGLGTGRAATEFVNALAERVRQGLEIRGIPTSAATAERARLLGIPLTTLEDVEEIDVTVDGADEVSPDLDLIKGLGGAMVREKIVAAASKRLIIVVGPGKEVAKLGGRGVLPVEVVPFALAFCRRRLERLGLSPTLRAAGDGATFVSDNGNYILDCGVNAIDDPQALEARINDIPGIVGTGLFLGMAQTVLVQDGDAVKVRQRP